MRNLQTSYYQYICFIWKQYKILSKLSTAMSQQDKPPDTQPRSSDLQRSSQFYYDLPLSTDAPLCEVRVCEYLQARNVRMASPCTVVDNPFVRPSSKGATKRGPSLLQSKRKGKFCKNFENLILDIEVPIKSKCLFNCYTDHFVVVSLFTCVEYKQFLPFL
eukprot:TRINITY_DN444_c0_g1_i8.p1 TRINITY_DN444_c0_g1~~TRINITY_DN444_c0_g1_i8.p1  ORF type:complete len:161 (-),score=11.70 TRINITY_DN444_c0_g1_i8:177-659(-)